MKKKRFIEFLSTDFGFFCFRSIFPFTGTDEKVLVIAFYSASG